MMAFLLPRFDCGPWGGGGIGHDVDLKGFCIAVAWLGLHVEFAIARERRA